MIIKLYFLKCCKNLYHILKKIIWYIYYFSHKKKNWKSIKKKKFKKKNTNILKTN